MRLKQLADRILQELDNPLKDYYLYDTNGQRAGLQW